MVNSGVMSSRIGPSAMLSECPSLSPVTRVSPTGFTVKVMPPSLPVTYSRPVRGLNDNGPQLLPPCARM